MEMAGQGIFGILYGSSFFLLLHFVTRYKNLFCMVSRCGCDLWGVVVWQLLLVGATLMVDVLRHHSRSPAVSACLHANLHTCGCK